MKNKLYICVAALLLSAPGCDVLEVEPVSDILSANFYKNADDAEAALMNVYDYMQQPVKDNIIVIPGAMADEFRVTRGGNFTRHENFAPTPVQGNVGDMWRALYFGIQAANDVIENVPNISDPALDADQVLGEAYFLRGMAFFYLTRLYGKIPLPTTASKSPNQDFNLSRSELPVVYEQIIGDLLQAEERLSATSTNRARASKGAARALLAKVYLFRNEPGDYQLALTETEEVMADNQYSLVPGENYASLFKVGEQNTAETIFEISYRPNRSVESHSIENETVPFIGNSPRVLPEQKLIDLFNENPQDLRLPISLGEYNDIVYTRKYELNEDLTVSDRGSQTNNVIILRLADVILMRAEALNELERTSEAIEYLNMIRARAGLDPTTATSQAEVRLAIENERYLELAFEGHRWFDLVRTGRAMDLVPQLTSPDRVLWPVPARDIDLNPNLLPQNPSY
ncbi:RagB/SusD domain-containing protein [Flammeovirgaceae bacterium 311]|nr:RagB/SusD domain-containing protein [Flammeovirgaceae bacterium 311]